MDIKATVKEIKRRVPVPPNRRARKGEWVEPAWAVRILVEKQGFDVAEAVRQVIAVNNFHPPDKAYAGIRAAFYVVVKQEWPKGVES